MTPNRAREIAEAAWRKFSASPAWNTQDVTLHIVEAVLLAVSEEREACAKIAMMGIGFSREACAAAIRERARCVEICEQHASAEGIAQRIRAQIVEDGA